MGFEVARAGDLFGEVFAGVEVFEEAGDGVDVVVEELNSARLLEREESAEQLAPEGLRRKPSCVARVLTSPSTNLSHISWKYGLLLSSA